jgi:hypothetical protein
MTAKTQSLKNTKTSPVMILSVGRWSIVFPIFVMSVMVTRGQIVPAATARDTTQTISFNASIDTYYHKSFGRKEDAPRTSFANLSGFSLGMINLIGEYSSASTGFVVDLVIGPRGSDALFNAPLYKNAQGGGSSHIINQMFVYYNISEHVRINAGQFNTFLGYEMIAPSKNANYSTSYLFSFGPFNHTGIWADVQFNKRWSAKLAVMNPADYTEFNPFNSYTLGGQLSVKGKKGTASFNATYGDPDGDLKPTDAVGSVSLGNALQLDFTGSIRFTQNYFVGISSSIRSMGSGKEKISDTDHIILKESGYAGVSLYQTIGLGKNQSLALRAEYFSEFNGGIGAINSYDRFGKADVWAMTLSGNLRKSNLCFIPEVRVDKTSVNSFTELGTDKPINHLVSLNMAVVYTLPTIIHTLN